MLLGGQDAFHVLCPLVFGALGCFVSPSWECAVRLVTASACRKSPQAPQATRRCTSRRCAHASRAHMLVHKACAHVCLAGSLCRTWSRAWAAGRRRQCCCFGYPCLPSSPLSSARWRQWQRRAGAGTSDVHVCPGAASLAGAVCVYVCVCVRARIESDGVCTQSPTVCAHRVQW